MARKKITIDLNGGDNVTADSALRFCFYDADLADIEIATANYAAVGSKDTPGTDGTNITYDLTTTTGSMILDGVDVGTATNLKVSVKDEANNESALSAAFSDNYLLDTFSGSVIGLSFRKLAELEPATVQLETGTGSESVNPAFNESLELTTPIVSGGTVGDWIGSNSAYLRNFFDQSGANNDFKDILLANQNTVINTGVVEKLNSLACVTVDNKGIDTDAAITLSTATDLWIFAVLDITNTGSQQNILSTFGYSGADGAINGAFEFVIIPTGELRIAQRIGPGASDYTIFSTASVPTSGQSLVTVQLTPGTTNVAGIKMWINGVSQTNSQVSQPDTIAFTDQVLSLLSRNKIDNIFNSKFQELLLFNTDQSANRTAIETNINNFYSIY